MSIRLYVGNLPQSFDQKELEGLFAAVGAGVRFKAVLDRDTGGCRGFGFVNLDDPKLTDAVIEQFKVASTAANPCGLKYPSAAMPAATTAAPATTVAPLPLAPPPRVNPETRWCTAMPPPLKPPIPAGPVNCRS